MSLRGFCKDEYEMGSKNKKMTILGRTFNSIWYAGGTNPLEEGVSHYCGVRKDCWGDGLELTRKVV